MDHIPITNIKVLGQAIYQARKERKLTQEELAARTGVSRRVIYQIENGSRDSFPFGKVLQILKRMNLELSISPRSFEK
jgi:y4mF family transcriptional regulator